MTLAPLTRARVLVRATPLIFANALVPLVGVIDVAVIGYAGDAAAIAGVGLGALVFGYVHFGLYFLRMSTTGLVAQAEGAADRARVTLVLGRAVIVAAALGAVVVALQAPLARLAFGLLQGAAAAEAAGHAYFAARVWGAPATLIGFALQGWFIGLGRSGTTLLIQGVVTAVNATLDVWFVLGLGLGPAGIGWATTIADWSGLGVGGAMAAAILRARGVADEGLSAAALLDRVALRRLIQVNRDLWIRTLALVFGWTWFANVAARMDTVFYAGNVALGQIMTLWAFALDAFAFTAEAEVGRAVGRHALADLRRAVRLTSEFAGGAAIIFTLVTLLVGPAVLVAIIRDPDAQRSALTFLPYCAAVPVIGVAAWQLDGIFIGATRGPTLRNAALAACALYLAADAVLRPALGGHGIWLAFLLFYVARAVTLAVAYPRLERGARDVNARGA